jgi:hypothetical protein
MSETTQRILLIIITGGLLLIVLELVRRKRLLERYALLWLFSAAVLIVLAAWRGLLTTIALAVGVRYPPSLLFLLAAGFELLLLMHFSLTNSRLTDQNKVLAQRLALLQRRLDEHEQQLDRLSGGTGSEERSASGEPTRARELSGKR